MAEQWDREKWKALGLEAGHMTTGDSTARYTVACIMRERERVARILENAGQPDLAAAIRDSSQDDLVFKYVGPETGLDVPPQPK